MKKYQINDFVVIMQKFDWKIQDKKRVGTTLSIMHKPKVRWSEEPIDQML